MKTKILISLFIFFWLLFNQSYSYNLTTEDNKIINNITKKVNILINDKWDTFLELFLDKIDELIITHSSSERITWIFIAIKNEYSEEEILENSEEENYIEEEIEEESSSEEAIEDENSDIENESNSDSYLSEYNIDFDSVKDYWFGMYQEVRDELWLYEYTYNSTLEKSAFSWSETQKENDYASHKRNENDDYYDYGIITDWFAEKWVVCKNVDWYTHTENVWWWEFSCTDWDCNDEFKSWIKRTFDYFMSEEDLSYRPHYLSIVNEYFNNVWLWISINELSENYYEFYLTVHYCTELE